MERVVIALLKLLLQLAWWLLKLALRIVLWAWTKDWHKLDKISAQVREAIEQAKRGQPKSAGATPRSDGAPRTKAVPVPPQWQFEFAPELSEQEPQGELQGGGSVIQPTKRRPARRKPAPVQPKELPLALALRDPKLVRDAMVLTAVLGPRTRGGRQF